LLLNRNTDLKKPEEVENYIATLKKKKGRDAEPATKNKFVFEYFKYCEIGNISFDSARWSNRKELQV
jgi:hypothetical protein